MTTPTSKPPTCEHFKQPPLGVTLTATAGPFVCPWCEIERLDRWQAEAAEKQQAQFALICQLEAERDRLRAALEPFGALIPPNGELYFAACATARAALSPNPAPAAISPLPSREDTAWLIEMAGERSEPLYWHAEPDMRCLGGFDADVNKAMRFCREKDARSMALMLGAKGMIALTDVRRIKITEHAWIATTKAHPAPAAAEQPSAVPSREGASTATVGAASAARGGEDG